MAANGVPSAESYDQQVTSAFECIMRSASIREVSSAKMITKLSSKGFSHDVIDEALRKAVEVRAVDDVRYSNLLIRSALNQGKGLSFVLKEISDLGIDPMELEAYQRFQEDGEDTMLDRALELLHRHPTRSKNIRGACYQKLVSKGYSVDIASEASLIYAQEQSKVR